MVELSKEVILVCGRVCCGKSTYVNKLIEKEGGLLFSCDELVLRLFGVYLGDRHEEITEKCKAYLMDRAVDAAKAGIRPVLDFGFWQKAERQRVQQYFISRGIRPLWHYVYVNEEQWEKNIALRNSRIENGQSGDYFIDKGLMEKFRTMFEEPEEEEIHYRYENLWSL